MVKLVSSQTHPTQKPEKENTPDKSSSKVARPNLKLIVSNPHPVRVGLPQETSDAKNAIHAAFGVEVHVKGPGLYEMALQDPSHYLKCDLFLEVEDRNQEYEGKVVICHFPNLDGEMLSNFVEEDETLYGALMIQFHMRILEQLFLFCATHYASTLVIFADDAQAEDLGIYEDFLASEDQTLTPKGEKTEMVIPADRQTFEAWLDFMQKTTADVQQTLWHEQKLNPVIRRYLKMHCARAQPSRGAL